MKKGIPPEESGEDWLRPSADDVKRAADIPLDQCPRRYCWYWHVLSFDWDAAPSEGCTFMKSEKTLLEPNPDIPCRRCDSNSQIDHYEPSEGNLNDDGFDDFRFVSRERLIEHIQNLRRHMETLEGNKNSQ